jgi:hypothetical protein
MLITESIFKSDKKSSAVHHYMRVFITTISLFLTLLCFGQTVTSRHFYSRQGFCSNSIILNSNQTYTEEGGCEGGSHVHFGKWAKVNDSTIQLMPNNIDIVGSISYQTDTARHECNTVRFKVTDVLGNPIYSFGITLYKRAIKTDNSNNWLIRNPSYTGQQTFEMDDSGFLEINYSSFDSMEFTSLKPYQNTKVKYPLKDLEGKIVTLKLNANAIAFMYPDVEFFKKEKPTVIRLRKKSIAISDANETWILNED